MDQLKIKGNVNMLAALIIVNLPMFQCFPKWPLPSTVFTAEQLAYWIHFKWTFSKPA